MNETFQHSDGWLLFTLYGRDRISESEIVGLGDALMKAVFTADELVGGRRRLSAAGFIELFEDGSAKITEKGTQCVATVTVAETGLISAMLTLCDWFEGKPVS